MQRSLLVRQPSGEDDQLQKSQVSKRLRQSRTLCLCSLNDMPEMLCQCWGEDVIHELQDARARCHCCDPGLPPSQSSSGQEVNVSASMKLPRQAAEAATTTHHCHLPHPSVESPRNLQTAAQAATNTHQCHLPHPSVESPRQCSATLKCRPSQFSNEERLSPWSQKHTRAPATAASSKV